MTYLSLFPSFRYKLTVQNNHRIHFKPIEIVFDCPVCHTKSYTL